MKTEMKKGYRGVVAVMAAGISTLAVLSALSGCTDTPPPAPEVSQSVAQEKGVAGGVFVNTLKMSVKVVAVDVEKRKLTLTDSDSKKFDATVGPEVVNLDQIHPGDLVEMTVTEELLVAVNAKGEEVPEGAASMVALAPVGSEPEGIVAGTRVVTANVADIDTGARTATLVFGNGQAETFHVRDDVDMSKYSVGQQVVFQLTEMVEVRVQKPQENTK